MGGPLGEVVWEPVRNRLVLFDMNQSTWEWDGTRWALHQQATSETPSFGARLAWDPVSQCVLAVAPFNSPFDTWAYDGIAWTRLQSSRQPTVFYNLALATDTARRVVVLFGGSPSTRTSETWEWSGSDWSQAAAGGTPNSASRAALVYDPVRRRTVLFGGDSGTPGGYTPIYDNTTWEWDGVAWRSVSVPGQPVGRNSMAMAFDPRRGRVVMHGGMRWINYWTSVEHDDTWEWDGSGWRSLGSGPAGTATMAFSATANEMVLATGHQTWTFDGSAWQQRIDEPGPFSAYAMAYDPMRQRAVLYGTVGGPFSSYGSARDKTWEHDGSRWLATSAAAPPGGPTVDPAMAFDPQSAAVIMVGPATWAWDGTAWRPVATGSKRGAAMATDFARGEVLLFTTGGQTWAWRQGTWVLRASTGPSGRSRSAMTFDPIRRTVVLFGGFLASGPANDTWVWDGTRWTQVPTANTPPGQTDHGLAWDAATGRVVLGGSSAGRVAPPASWAFDGVDWTQLSTTGLPLGFDIAMTAAQSGRILATTSRNSALETWEFGIEPAATHTLLGLACGSAAPAPGLACLGLPRVGRREFAVDVGRAPPGSAGALMLGATSVNASLGGGCWLYVDPMAVALLPFVTGPSGAASLPLPIPRAMPLGARLFGQVGVLDPGAPFVGIALTQQLVLDVGR